jgi:PAS domain S-box-containing protein
MDASPHESPPRSLLRLRALGYSIAAPALATAWWLHRTPQLAILAAATTLGLVWNTLYRKRTTPMHALGMDLAGTALIWWLFGSIPVVYFGLTYVVVVSSIILPRRHALTMVAVSAMLIGLMGAANLVDGRIALPLFSRSANTWIGRLEQFGIPLGIVLYTAVLVLDIAQVLEGSRRELASKEARLRLSFDGAAMGMVTFELEGTLTQVNKAFCEQTGYTESQLLSMSWRHLVLPEDQPAAEAQLRKALAEGPIHWRAEDRLVRADGSQFWAGIVMTLIHDEAGHPHSYLAQVLDISERKDAERALVASEQRYRSLFEGIPVALYRTSPEGKILDANPALVDLLGFPNRESMLEMDVHDAYADGNRREEFIRRLETEGRLIGVEAQLQTYDGTPIWVRDSSRVVMDDNGKIAFYEGALVDTTARHAAETALRESEARLRAIFEHAPIGILAVDLNLRIVAANTGLAHMLGRQIDELRGMNVTDLTHPDDRDLDGDMKDRLLAGNISSYRYVKRYVHSDGHPIWVELSVTAVRDEHGEPELFIGLIQDITERRKAESDREQMVKILEATTDLVAIFDVQGRVAYANAAARAWSGDLLDRQPTNRNVAEMIDTGNGPSAQDIFNHLLTEDVWDGDVTLRSPTGEFTPGSAVVIAHRDGHGMITHISATFRDLEERIQTQRRLERLVQSKDEFVASVSHELRTPLTAVVGLAQELRKSWNAFTTQEISEFIGLVADQATEVANLVEDLLVAARADIGKVTVNPRTVEVTDQIDGVVAALDAPSRDRVQTDVTPVQAWADPTRLRQILRNLLTNAIRYGGKRIELSARAANGLIEFRISDDGPGISPGLEEKVFEPYARAHELGSQPNSVGLGLTVSRHLARLMGGDLVYLRDPHSTFVLTLPAAHTVAASSEIA